ncbi:MAG TPA: hypothetical protein HPP87_08020 [Planctomycetes bacterium]|nr:hypothetical protein [Planctomycetota bacterium]
MKKAKFILSVLLFCLFVAVGGCRYPIKGADFAGDVVEEAVFFGEGQELAPFSETEAQRRARWERVERIAFQQIMEDWDSFWLVEKPSRLSDKYIR